MSRTDWQSVAGPIHTQRLQLLPYEPEHAAALYALIRSNEKDMLRYFPNTAKACDTPEGTEAFIQLRKKMHEQGEAFFYHVFLEDQLIGRIGLREVDPTVPKCEIGYWIDYRYRRKGYAAETLRAILERFPFERFYARVIPDNTASIELLRTVGFQQEGILRNDFRDSLGELNDVVLMGFVR